MTQVTLLSKVRLKRNWPPERQQENEGWVVTGFHGSLKHGVWWYLTHPMGGTTSARTEELEVIGGAGNG